MKKVLLLLAVLGLTTSVFGADAAFTNLAGSGASSEAGVRTTIQSLMWIFAFLPFIVAGAFGAIAYKKAKENSDREDNTKELAVKTMSAVVLGIVFMIIVYGFIGKGVLGAATFGGGWDILVTQWWATTLSLT